MMWLCGLAHKLWLQSRWVLTIPIKSSKLCLLWAGVAILERTEDEVFKMGKNNGKSADNDKTQSQAHSTKNQGCRQFEKKVPKEIRIECHDRFQLPRERGQHSGQVGGKGNKVLWNLGNASSSRMARKLIRNHEVCRKYTQRQEEALEISGI